MTSAPEASRSTVLIGALQVGHVVKHEHRAAALAARRHPGAGNGRGPRDENPGAVLHHERLGAGAGVVPLRRFQAGHDRRVPHGLHVVAPPDVAV